MIEVAAAFLIKEGRVLLGLRAQHKSYAGCWDGFGGHLEAGETVRDALCRELIEELGIAIEGGERIAMIRLDHPSEGNSLLHLFQVKAWSGEAAIKGDEHVEARWFTLNEVQALTNLAISEYRPLIAAILLPTETVKP